MNTFGKVSYALLSLLVAGSALAVTGGAGQAQGYYGRGGFSQQSNLWSTDLTNSLQSAKNDNKLVLVDVYTDWCGWCKKLDRDTYGNPQVQQFLNGKFVCVKLNAEDGATGQAFAQRYGVHGFPATLVLDGNGRLRGSISGYKEPGAFEQALQQFTGGG